MPNLFDDFLVLRGDEELGLLALHELVVLPDGLGDLGLGHAHSVDLEPWRHLGQVLKCGNMVNHHTSSFQFFLPAKAVMDAPFLSCLRTNFVVNLVDL